MTPPAKSKRCTLADVARNAQVSRATAFAALNKSHGTNIGISAERRQQVLRVAAELGYIRNDLARSLASGKSKMIGVLVPNLSTQFYSDFFSALDDACFANGYTVFVSSSKFDREREARSLQAFLAKRVDAVIVARGEPGAHDALLQQMQAQGIAVILQGEVDVQGLPYPVVGFDEPAVGRLAAKHVWSLGHRRILYFNAGKVRDNSLRIHTIRRALFENAWHALGGGDTVTGFETADPLHGGMELAEHLLQLPRAQWPTAVACSMDSLAISLSAALRTHRVKVPRDVAIIGCDDIPGAGEAAVPLSTVRLPTEKMAQGVWSLLKPQLTEQPRPIEAPAPQRLVIPPELIVRQSTGTVTARKAQTC
jgi:LacI family transcriptional regulator